MDGISSKDLSECVDMPAGLSAQFRRNMFNVGIRGLGTLAILLFHKGNNICDFVFFLFFFFFFLQIMPLLEGVYSKKKEITHKRTNSSLSE